MRSRNSTRNFFWKHANGQEKEKLGGVAQTACESIDFPWRYRGGRGGSTAVNVVASSPPRARAARPRARAVIFFIFYQIFFLDKTVYPPPLNAG